MLLKRDIAAVLIAVVLSHIAWNRQELQSASVHLSFYLSHRRNGPRDVMNPAIMDIDGDELPDTLVHILLENEDTWKIKVMDIQSEHRGKRGRTSAAAVPFQPAVVLESPPILGKDIHPKDIPEFAAPLMPLKMTVGHVSLKGGAGGGSKSWNQKNKVGSADNKRNTQEISERNRKMFCGSDWHHAAKCRKPCPSGSSADCPEDERCFADTPCDYYTYQKEREQQTQKKDDLTVEMESLLADTRNVTRTYHLSPVGGLPR